ncbi:MAG: DUF1963 domain-containing protein [Neisseriaceae bacterium]|nr:DUF1963 domain-containing protein [Neisseriaceae bacterium]
MNTQQDFELTAEEMAEWKTFLAHYSVGINHDLGINMNRSDFAVLNEPSAIKDYLLKIEQLEIYDIKKLPNNIQYLTNLKYLSFCNCPFKTLPEQIGQLDNLQKLEISCFDKLSSLPERIGQLDNLHELHISHCEKLSSIPESIGRLNNLQELHISSCEKLSSIPEQIGQLDNLQKLEISYCDKLFSLPEQIGQLKNLQELHISFCYKLSSLPERIGQLENLEKLHIGYCEKLSSIPEQIGQLEHLQKLGIHFCKELSSIPESIGQLNNLQELYIHSCDKLSSIPESIAHLKNLKSLHIYNCKSLEEQAKEKITLAFERKKVKNLTPEGKKVKKVLTQLKKDTSIPLIKIKAKKAKNLPLTASKFGGVPYWLPETPYPVDENGDKLVLLAQINCSELPPLPDFPTTGLLQFFISTSGEVDYDNLISQKRHCVVYHEKIDDNISQQQVLALNIPLTTQDAEDFDYCVPVEGEYALSFTAGKSGIGLHNHDFGELLKQTAQALKITLDEEYDEAINLYDVIGKDAYNKLEESIYGHHIGGYPHFCQEDPRDDFPEYKILLLQIDSKNGIDWGEYGVGNFFITADDLKKRDFGLV